MRVYVACPGVCLCSDAKESEEKEKSMILTQDGYDAAAQRKERHGFEGCRRRLCASDPKDEPAKSAVASDNADHDANPLASVADVVAVVVENGGAGNEALVCQLSLVQAGAALTRVLGRCAGEVAGSELVDHHALEDVRLVVNVVEDVAPEGIEGLRRYEETSSAHPKTVGKGGGGQCNDEDGHDRADQDDEGLGSEQIEEEPHDPGEESLRGGAEVG